MTKLLLLALSLLGAQDALGAPRIGGSPASSGFTAGQDVTGDDGVFKTLQSTGTAPSLTATGAVFKGTVTLITTSAESFGINGAGDVSSFTVTSGQITNKIQSDGTGAGSAGEFGYFANQNDASANRNETHGFNLYYSDSYRGGLRMNTNTWGVLELFSKRVDALGQIVFRTGNDTEYMRLGTTGNLGIGTASPSKKLHVSSGAVMVDGTGGQFVYNGDAGSMALVGKDGVGGLYLSSTYGALLTGAGSAAAPYVQLAAGEANLVAAGGNISCTTAGCGANAAGVAGRSFTITQRAADSYAVQVASQDLSVMLSLSSSNLLAVNGSIQVAQGATRILSTGAYTASLGQTVARSCATGTTTDAAGVFDGCVASDRSLKASIASLRYDPKAIDSLRPVSYKWKKGTRRDAREHIGFIAQEVNEVSPQAVIPAGVGLSGIDPNAVLALVVKELQTLRKRVAELEKK